MQDYRDAVADPLHPHADRILDHMNDDHADALVSFCQVLGGTPDTDLARMVRVDRYGFDVCATVASTAADRAVRIPFPAPADTPDAVRAAMIALLADVRSP